LEFSAPKNTKLAPLTVSGFAYIAVFGPVLRPVKRLLGEYESCEAKWSVRGRDALRAAGCALRFLLSSRPEECHPRAFPDPKVPSLTNSRRHVFASRKARTMEIVAVG
jgi:hypothetical protein